MSRTGACYSTIASPSEASTGTIPEKSSSSCATVFISDVEDIQAWPQKRKGTLARALPLLRRTQPLVQSPRIIEQRSGIEHQSAEDHELLPHRIPDSTEQLARRRTIDRRHSPPIAAVPLPRCLLVDSRITSAE